MLLFITRNLSGTSPQIVRTAYPGQTTAASMKWTSGDCLPERNLNERDIASCCNAVLPPTLCTHRMLSVTPVRRQSLDDELLRYRHNILFTEEPWLINTPYLSDKTLVRISFSICHYKQCLINFPSDKHECTEAMLADNEFFCVLRLMSYFLKGSVARIL
jgi:hypothetical protein